ncbi:MAG: homoserine dehydrogenase [Vicinamibacterales bacterium]
MRTIRIGLLGLGRVGSAVVRAAGPAAPWIAPSGLALIFERALVRDVNRPGRPPNIPLVDHPHAFLAGDYGLVVEALGGVEPARSLVAALLERGTPVVTANKSLLAAAGEELAAAAARGRTALRYEASALAGVPFLGTFSTRPLVRAVERFAGIVNGTSNYILSAMEADRLSFADALSRAQALGLAEPDPRADVEGRDAAEKLVLLLRHLGARGVRREAIETEGIAGLDAADLEIARAFGGRLKPIVHARLRPRIPADQHGSPTVECFVGPAFVEASDALSEVSGALNGIRLDGRFVRGLFFSGPGAGPDVTAATILDDIVEAVTGDPRTSSDPLGLARTSSHPLVHAPDSRWFIRFDFPSRAPVWPLVSDLLAAKGVWLGRTSTPRAGPGGERLWALTHAASRQSIDAALRSLAGAIGARTLALRVLERAAPNGVDGPAPSGVEERALSGVEGPALSGVEG